MVGKHERGEEAKRAPALCTGPPFYHFPHIDCLRARDEWQMRQEDLDSGSLSRCHAMDSSLSSQELDRLMRAEIKYGDVGYVTRGAYS